MTGEGEMLRGEAVPEHSEQVRMSVALEKMAAALERIEKALLKEHD